jgi:hypothetical protein
VDSRDVEGPDIDAGEAERLRLVAGMERMLAEYERTGRVQVWDPSTDAITPLGPTHNQRQYKRHRSLQPRRADLEALAHQAARVSRRLVSAVGVGRPQDALRPPLDGHSP